MSEDTRLSMCFYGDPSVCACVNVCVHMYIDIYVYGPRKNNMYILYVMPKKEKSSDTQSSEGA